MDNWKNYLKTQTIRLLDHTTKHHSDNKMDSAMTSFAIDDAIALSVSDNSSPATLRLWSHDKTVVLGIPDGRLPYLEEGVRFLHHHQYDVIIRNSGGLAVALDEGVINLSLILPAARQLSINDAYDIMYQFVQLTLQDLTTNIRAYEIVGSFCPGDYDLSINGVKFAGISQRRLKNGVTIHIYIDVNGDSKTRAEIVRDFYDLSLKNEQTTFTYPTVKPEKMASLATLLNTEITTEQMIERIKHTITKLSKEVIISPLTDQELTTFETRFAQMHKRNEKISEYKLNR